MARFSHLPIYKASFKLLVYIEDIVIHMEKKARYTLGSDLRNISREFVVSIARVNTMQPSQRLKTMLEMFDLINQIYILLSRPNYCYCVIVCMTFKALKLQTFTKK